MEENLLKSFFSNNVFEISYQIEGHQFGEGWTILFYMDRQFLDTYRHDIACELTYSLY